MMASVRHTILLMVAALTFMGCSQSDDAVDSTPVVEGLYGSYTFGEEQIPVNAYTVSDGDWLLVMLTPLEQTASAGTYAVIGINPALLGVDVDVENAYCNDDYVFSYEDPTYYHAPFRPLQSGTVHIDVNGSTLSIMADVVTYDGQVFKYENNTLAIE